MRTSCHNRTRKYWRAAVRTGWARLIRTGGFIADAEERKDRASTRHKSTRSRSRNRFRTRIMRTRLHDTTRQERRAAVPTGRARWTRTRGFIAEAEERKDWASRGHKSCRNRTRTIRRCFHYMTRHYRRATARTGRATWTWTEGFIAWTSRRHKNRRSWSRRMQQRLVQKLLQKENKLSRHDKTEERQLEQQEQDGRVTRTVGFIAELAAEAE